MIKIRPGRFGYIKIKLLKLFKSNKKEKKMKKKRTIKRKEIVKKRTVKRKKMMKQMKTMKKRYEIILSILENFLLPANRKVVRSRNFFGYPLVSIKKTQLVFEMKFLMKYVQSDFRTFQKSPADSAFCVTFTKRTPNCGHDDVFF